jgi:ABC-2 type transport system ATP-binding protein
VEAAERVLHEGGLRVRRDAGLLLVEGVPDPAEVTRRLAHHELYVNELVPVRADLESVFLQLTGPESLEADLADDGRKVLR